MRDLEDISFLVTADGSQLTSSGEDESDTGESHERRASLSSSGLEGLFRKVKPASAGHERMCWNDAVI